MRAAGAGRFDDVEQNMVAAWPEQAMQNDKKLQGVMIWGTALSSKEQDAAVHRCDTTT